MSQLSGCVARHPSVSAYSGCPAVPSSVGRVPRGPRHGSGR